MASWKKIEQKTESGAIVSMQAPYIVSASRSTDIPAFYADWFFHRLKAGYSAWTNPFNGVKMYVSYKETKFVVFWSKNPRPLLTYLDKLGEMGIGCYIQYTLNDYEKEGLEKGVRPLDERIETFKLLVDKLGKGAVVWRFDPLILTDTIDIDDLLSKIEYIGDQLKGYTEKLVFSFADIAAYRKVRVNLDKSGIKYKEWDENLMTEFASKISELNRKWGYELATCGERIDIDQFGIKHNHCIDDRLIVRFGYRSKELLDFLDAEIVEYTQQEIPFFDAPSTKIPNDAICLQNGLYAIIKKDNKDKGQRDFCGCMKSKDIGQYNTCIHMCEYCYANTSKESAAANYRSHKSNPLSETITGI